MVAGMLKVHYAVFCIIFGDMLVLLWNLFYDGEISSDHFSALKDLDCFPTLRGLEFSF